MLCLFLNLIIWGGLTFLLIRFVTWSLIVHSFPALQGIHHPNLFIILLVHKVFLAHKIF